METYRQTFLIYNPFAGGLKRREPVLRRAIETLSARGMQIEAVPTTGPATASAIARRCIERGADLILAAGGDGTINEVVNGMAHSDVPLGILPAGTANVLATELALGKSMQRAAESLCECVPERIALGRLSTQGGASSRYFLLMAGAGLDAEIVFELNGRLKNAIGKGAYWLGGLRKFGRPLHEFTVEAEGRQFRASFALASRVRNYGGDLEIAPSISLLDDQFELVLFAGASSITFAKYLLGVAARRHHRMRGVTILRTRRASFFALADPAIHLQVDGEYAGTLPAQVEIVPNALTLLAPATLRERRPASVEDREWTTSPIR